MAYCVLTGSSFTCFTIKLLNSTCKLSPDSNWVHDISIVGWIAGWILKLSGFSNCQYCASGSAQLFGRSWRPRRLSDGIMFVGWRGESNSVPLVHSQRHYQYAIATSMFFRNVSLKEHRCNVSGCMDKASKAPTQNPIFYIFAAHRAYVTDLLV